MQLVKIFVRDILFSFLLTPVRFVAGLVPKDKKLVVFGSWMGKNFSDNPKFFRNYLEGNHKNLRLIILLKNKKEINRLNISNKEAYHQYSLHGLYYALRANLVCITHSVKEDINIAMVSWNTNVLHFWHGTPVKKLTSLGFLNSKGHKNLKRLYRLLTIVSNIFFPDIAVLVVASDFASKALNEFFYIHIGKILLSGYPRNDMFFSDSPNPSRTAVLYLPTYRNKFSVSPVFERLSELDTLLEGENYDFVIKPHPAMSRNVDFSKYKNIHGFFEYFGTGDAQEGMAKADILISDYSGIIYDFFLSDRPIIFFPYDIDEYRKTPGFYFDYLKEFPGPFARSCEELFDLITNVQVWFNKPEYVGKYRKFKAKYNKFSDGKSSRRVYNFLVESNIL